jgi:GTP-binding protein HflX
MPAGEQGRESLVELVELARSAGAEIAGTVFQMRDTADPATLVGRGKLDEIRAEAAAHKAPLIIFDRISLLCSSATLKKRRNAA